MLSLVSSKEPKDEHFPTYAYFWHYEILDSFRYYLRQFLVDSHNKRWDALIKASQSRKVLF